METINIRNHSELLLRIEELKTTKMFQEEEFKLTFNELFSSIDIISIIQGTRPINKDQPVEFVKTGLTMAFNLITGLVLGKHRSIKGYLSALAVERFTTMLIDNNLINIISGISSLIGRFRNKNTNT